MSKEYRLGIYSFSWLSIVPNWFEVVVRADNMVRRCMITWFLSSSIGT